MPATIMRIYAATIMRTYKASHRRPRGRRLLLSQVSVMVGATLIAAAALVAAVHL